jgi:hypothetical protein
MAKERKRATGVYDKRSVKIGFHEWNLDSVEKAMNLIIKEAMTIATEEYVPLTWFAHEYGPNSDGVNPRRKPPADVSTIFVELPLGPTEDDNPRWSFTLSEMVASAIENHEHGEGGHIDPKDAASLIAIRDMLRQQADTIDAALARPDPDAPRRYA